MHRVHRMGQGHKRGIYQVRSRRADNRLRREQSDKLCKRRQIVKYQVRAITSRRQNRQAQECKKIDIPTSLYLI
jgi:hypothetical protein